MRSGDVSTTLEHRDRFVVYSLDRLQNDHRGWPFGLGTDTTIATLDVDGVTLAAVQALEKPTADQRAEIAALRNQNAALRARIDEILQRLEHR